MPQGFPRPKKKIPAHKKRIMEEYKKRFLDQKKRGEKAPPPEKKVKPMRPFPENKFKKKKALPMPARPTKQQNNPYRKFRSSSGKPVSIKIKRVK